jgi:hypothetical protein
MYGALHYTYSTSRVCLLMYSMYAKKDSLPEELKRIVKPVVLKKEYYELHPGSKFKSK